MIETPLEAAIFAAIHVFIQIALCLRVLIRPHREPASRIAWIVVIVTMPLVGIVAYLLFGEVNVGRSRIQRMRDVLAQMPSLADAAGADAPSVQPDVPERYAHLFRVAHSINGFEPVGGNRARLMEDSNATIASLVADVDSATDHVHLLFYIWLADNNGCQVVDALKRAAARGVACRAMADGLGSRAIIKSRHWQEMQSAGVHLAVALPIGNPLVRIFKGRIDLRNHRKIVVIDDRITYCGSQNCADPEFRVKAKYAPWVDAVMRFEGPIARQNQHLFAADWMAHTNEDLNDLLRQPTAPTERGLTAQVAGTGPTVRYSAMPEMFASLMYTARRELRITTPYYVPNEPMQAALCAAARRGVATTVVFPARNDSWIVSAASRSYYAGLLEAGVRIFEFEGGLLHTKSLTLDGEVSLIGSANMDRRSFDLNYENNILFCDPASTIQLRQRQDSYIASSHEVTREMVANWPMPRRLWNNAIAMLGPIL